MKNFFNIIMLTPVLLCSCGNCEQSAGTYRSIDLEVVLTEQPTLNTELNLVGTKINSDKISTTRIVERWYRQFIDSMSIGDTIIKKKGELTLYIHKKDTILSFDWECEGKIYN